MADLQIDRFAQGSYAWSTINRGLHPLIKDNRVGMSVALLPSGQQITNNTLVYAKNVGVDGNTLYLWCLVQGPVNPWVNRSMVSIRCESRTRWCILVRNRRQGVITYDSLFTLWTIKTLITVKKFNLVNMTCPSIASAHVSFRFHGCFWHGHNYDKTASSTMHPACHPVWHPRQNVLPKQGWLSCGDDLRVQIGACGRQPFHNKCVTGILFSEWSSLLTPSPPGWPSSWHESARLF